MQNNVINSLVNNRRAQIGSFSWKLSTFEFVAYASGSFAYCESASHKQYFFRIFNSRSGSSVITTHARITH